MTEHAFSPLIIKGRTLLPIVQGGMGVGVSAHRLAGAVAKEGGVGTIASVDLRHLHADMIRRDLHDVASRVIIFPFVAGHSSWQES